MGTFIDFPLLLQLLLWGGIDANLESSQKTKRVQIKKKKPKPKKKFKSNSCSTLVVSFTDCSIFRLIFNHEFSMSSCYN